MEKEYKYINENTYTTVTGRMIIELGLKGNELLVYSLINGFCQDGESQFYGSLAYLQEFTSMSKQGVINVLESLIEQGLIIKTQKVVNNVTFNSYKTLPPVKKVDNPTSSLADINKQNKKESISKDIQKKEEMALPFDSPRLRELWENLLCYPEWKKKTHHALELRIKALERVSGGDVNVAIASIKQTLDKGWLDFYNPAKEYFEAAAPAPTQQAKPRKPIWEELGMTYEQYKEQF